MSDERLTMTVEEVGRALGISRALAYTLARSGAIPVLRLGRRLLVPRKSLEGLLASAGSPKEGRSRGAENGEDRADN